MRVYYFKFYWPSNLVFVVRCVTYISNLRGQKLQLLSRAIGTSHRRTAGQTDRETLK